MRFKAEGFRHFPGAIDDTALARLDSLFRDSARPGIRLSPDALRPVADILRSEGTIGRIATELLGCMAFPVRALLLDKNAEANWALGWHQDRTIAVTERHETEGFGPWTVKQGQVHVQPPHSLLERMVTLRVHLDPVPDGNGPLLVVPGSHRLSRISEDQVARLATSARPVANLAERGDIWAYSTPILHSSAAAATTFKSRRVLQLDYACEQLPGKLSWLLQA